MRLIRVILLLLGALWMCGCLGMLEWQSEKEAYTARIIELEKRCNDYRKKYYEMIERIEKQQENSQRQINTLKQKLASLQKSTDEKIRELENKNDELQFALDEKNKHLTMKDEKYKATVASLNSQIEEFKSDLAEARQAKSSIQQKLSQEQQKLQKYQDVIDSLKAENQRLEDQVASYRSEATDKEDTVARLERKIESLESTINDLESEKGQLAGKAEATSERESGLAISSDVKDAVQDFKRALSGEINAGNIDVALEKKGLVITIQNESVFDPGSVILSDNGKTILATIENQLNDTSYEQITVEGHTDNQPLENLPFYDNWALGSARATNVVRHLVGLGIDPEQLQSLTASWYQSVASNSTAEGRRKNRRVEIAIR